MADNIIFITVDDMNNWATLDGFYTGPVHTPNLDRLMAAGTNFTNAFCTTALCNPSRTTIFTGQDPLHTQIIFGNAEPWYFQVPAEETIHGQFQSAGYDVAMIRKTYHHMDTMSVSKLFDEYVTVPITAAPGGTFNAYQGDEHQLTDYKIADAAVNFIRNHTESGSDQGFMLNVGFFQPHLPWVAPSRYYDIYPLDQIVLPATYTGDHSDIPPDAPSPTASFLRFQSTGQWPQLVQAYLASVSFMDAQLGRILDEVDAHPELAAETSIVLVSDHGQYIGEKERLGKNGMWEEALNAPLVIVDPRHEGGKTVDAVVSFADIAPTILELAGLPAADTMDGRSLVPLIDNPQAAWDDVAFSIDIEQFSIRTDRYRYSLYSQDGEELYDIVADRHEFTNLAALPAYAAIKAELRQRLEDHFLQFNLVRPDVDDTVSSGSSADDTLMDLGRPMTLAGTGGNDTYLVRNPNTVISEAVGAGLDTVILNTASYIMPSNVEDLSTLGFDKRQKYLIYGNEADNRISSDSTGNTEVHGGDGNDLIRGQESGIFVFFGDAGKDTLNGSNLADRLNGGDGNDYLGGGGGGDTLLGGDGADTLNGGPGADRQTGGLGNDIFRLSAAGESTSLAPDIITDFEGAGAQVGDRIDVFGIDANSTIAGNQAFSSLGYCSSFTGFTALQQLMIVDNGADAIVYGNTDGNMATAEFAIVLQNVEHTSVTMADFLL